MRGCKDHRGAQKNQFICMELTFYKLCCFWNMQVTRVQKTLRVLNRIVGQPKSQMLSNLSSAWLLTSEFQFASQQLWEISDSFGKFTEMGKNLRGWGGSQWLPTLQLMEAVRGETDGHNAICVSCLQCYKLLFTSQSIKIPHFVICWRKKSFCGTLLHGHIYDTF